MTGTPTDLSKQAISRLRDTLPLPILLSNEAPPHRLIAAGLLVKIASGAKASAALADSGSRSEVSPLVRSIYEHLVMLAWITAGDHDRRIHLWEKADLKKSLTIDRELEGLDGVPAMTPEQRRKAKEDLEAYGPGSVPTLQDRAKQADEYWHPLLVSENSSLMSLSILYSTLYRTSSAYTHPTLVALEAVVETTDTHCIFRPELTGEDRGLVAMTVHMLALALKIGHRAISVSDPHQVDAVFDWLVAQEALTKDQ